MIISIKLRLCTIFTILTLMTGVAWGADTLPLEPSAVILTGGGIQGGYIRYVIPYDSYLCNEKPAPYDLYRLCLSATAVYSGTCLEEWTTATPLVSLRTGDICSSCTSQPCTYYIMSRAEVSGSATVTDYGEGRQIICADAPMVIDTTDRVTSTTSVAESVTTTVDPEVTTTTSAQVTTSQPAVILPPNPVNPGNYITWDAPASGCGTGCTYDVCLTTTDYLIVTDSVPACAGDTYSTGLTIEYSQSLGTLCSAIGSTTDGTYWVRAVGSGGSKGDFLGVEFECEGSVATTTTTSAAVSSTTTSAASTTTTTVTVFSEQFDADGYENGAKWSSGAYTVKWYEGDSAHKPVAGCDPAGDDEYGLCLAATTLGTAGEHSYTTYTFASAIDLTTALDITCKVYMDAYEANINYQCVQITAASGLEDWKPSIAYMQLAYFTDGLILRAIGSVSSTSYALAIDTAYTIKLHLGPDSAPETSYIQLDSETAKTFTRNSGASYPFTHFRIGEYGGGNFRLQVGECIFTR